MPSFEDIHSNHKWAFVDGLLCGITLAWIGKLWYDAWHIDTRPETPVEDLDTHRNKTAN